MIKRNVIAKALLVFTFLVSIFLSSYSRALAAPLDPRWKLYNSGERLNNYYDIKTIEYDPNEQIAKVWTLCTGSNGGKSKRLALNAISFKDKYHMGMQVIKYNNDGELVTNFIPESNTWHSIAPDTIFEALANSVASELHIKPIYPGGPDRWKWLHSTDKYGLYVAKDTIVYDSDLSEYSIWTKRIYLDNYTPETLYSVNFTDKTIWVAQSMAPWIQYEGHIHPIPESDEEYIYNAVKDLAQNLKYTQNQ